MKRNDDPVRVKLRAERERAGLWLDVLCKGIGQSLAEVGRCEREESVRFLIGRVNGELLEAVAAWEKAEKAYEPYWSRTRHRRVTITPKKKPAPVAVQ